MKLTGKVFEDAIAELEEKVPNCGRALAIGALIKAKDMEEAQTICEYFTPGNPNYTREMPECLKTL